jgi:hypothetical protein
MRLGANVPPAVKDLLGRLLKSNGTTADILRQLEQTKITPRLDVDIAQSGSVNVTGNVHVTADKAEGVTGGGGGVKVVTGKAGSISVDVDVTKGQGQPNVTATLNWTFGDSPPKFTCPVDEKHKFTFVPEYDCELFTHIPESVTPAVEPKTSTDTQQVYVYFNYKEATPTKAWPTSAEASNLAEKLGAGYRVTSIDGYTSPEGPLDPHPGFEGNIELAKKRAEMALALVKQMGGAVDKVQPTGHAERCSPPPKQVGKKLVEVEGNELVDFAVECFKKDPAEERNRTPELMKKLDEAKSHHQRASLIYPFMRRAVVTLEKTTVTKAGVPEKRTAAKDVWQPVPSCPDDVIKAAQPQFNLASMLTGTPS